MRNRNTAWKLLIGVFTAIALSLVFLPACGDDGSSADSDTAPPPAPAPA